jgi:hypothetical protein
MPRRLKHSKNEVVAPKEEEEKEEGRNACILTISSFTPRQLYTKMTNLVLYYITLFDSLMKVSCGPKHVTIFSVIM